MTEPAAATSVGVGIRVRVRLFAMQRELAGTRHVDLELPAGATIEDAWRALVERFPALAPGRPAVRFARNAEYAPPETGLADDDEVAMIPPVSGGSGDAESNATPDVAPDPTPGRLRILEIRTASFGREILDELAGRLTTPDDGACVAFLGLTRQTPGTPAPGQEGEAARHAGRTVESLEYEALPEMALRVMADIADEIEARFGVRRLGIIHREGVVPLGEASVAIAACSPHRDAAFDAARYAIDEIKARVPIWKAERFKDGHLWIGEPAREGPAND